MKELFKKMQEGLGTQKIEIIPDNPEDAETAKQMADFLNYMINDFLSLSNELVDDE